MCFWGEERAIVTEIAGNYQGYPWKSIFICRESVLMWWIRRESGIQRDVVEKIGVDRAMKAARDAGFNYLCGGWFQALG